MNDVELKAYFDKHYSCQNIQLFLKDLGVPPKHIAYLEEQTIQGYGLPSKVFDYLGRVNNVIIPTHLIIGSHLEGNIGHDWIDLMKYAFCDDYQNRSMNLKPNRLRACLAYLYDLGWETWNQTYQTHEIGELYFSSLENGQSVQYMHEGGKGGGRHRFFASKIAGATHIRATYVDQYRLNREKLYYYQSYKQLEQHIKYHVQHSTIFEKHAYQQLDGKDCYQVDLIHCDDNYVQDLGELFVEEYELKKLDDFKQYVNTLEAILDSLKAIEVLAIQVTQRRYQWLPIWYVKNKISSKMKLNAYSNAFLMKRDDVWDYLKWHLLYDYKLKK